MSERISVIIPVYNVAPFLGQCVQSVIQQTYKDLQIILIDDGSTDGSDLIMKELAAMDRRVVVVSQGNRGVSAARNNGLSLASGKYILFLDADDYIETDALESAYRKLSEQSLDIIFFDTKAFGEKGFSLEAVEAKKRYYARKHNYSSLLTGETLLYQMLENGEYSCPVWKQVFRRDFLLENQLSFYEGIIHEDELFTLKAMLLAQRVSYIGRVLHHRRLRQGSIMTSPPSFQSVYGYFVCVREAYQFILEKECCLKKRHLLYGLLDQISLYARREFNCLSWEERGKINYLPEEERFLFRIFVTADLEKLNNKESKQKEGRLIGKLRRIKGFLSKEVREGKNGLLRIVSGKGKSKSKPNDLKNDSSVSRKESAPVFAVSPSGCEMWKEDERYVTAARKLQFMQEIFSDSSRNVAGWLHDFVCPHCAALLKFELAADKRPDRSFICPNCGKEVSGERYFNAWVYQYRYYFASELDNIVICAHAGNKEAVSFLTQFVDFYADRYADFAVHGDHAGKGKIMGQSLDEAVWGIFVVRCINLCRRFISEKTMEKWFDKLFAPMVRLLLPQGESVQNISVWIQACVGMIGITFNRPELIEKALHGGHGLYVQLERGLTKDFIWHEGSFHYHYYLLDALTYFCELYSGSAPKSQLVLLLEKMYDSVMPAVYDGYHILAVNDSWYPVTLKDYALQIIRAAAITRNTRLLEMAGNIRYRFPEIFREPGTLLYETRLTNNYRFLFDNHMVLLSKPFPVFLKSGSCTASHSHKDLFSIIIPPCFLDLGAAGYGSPMNDSWLRTSLAHNSISVDGKQPDLLINTTIRETDHGVEAFTEDWPDIDSISRSLTVEGLFVKDCTEIHASTEHIYEWTFHSEDDVDCNLDGKPADLTGGAAYRFFYNTCKLDFTKDLTVNYKNKNGHILTVTVPYNLGIEIYTAQTPGNPANTMRNTILCRTKGKNVKFVVFYSANNAGQDGYTL